MNRLQRLRIPHTVLVPKQCGLVINGRDSYFIEGEKHIRPRLVLNALFNHPGSGLEYVEALELIGIPVINSAVSWRRAKSKPLSSAALARAGIPQPECAFSCESPTLSALVKNQKNLFVSKPWSGSGGKGIVRRRGPQMSLRLKKRPGRHAYIQRYIPNKGRDIRVVVVDGKAIGASYRVARKGHWKTNVAGGGKAIYCKLTDELASMAVRATRALNLDVSGVDIMESSGRKVVLEINAWPNYHIFDRVARVDVALKIAELVARRTRQ